MNVDMTPNTPLEDGEEVLTSFRADRATYVRANTRLAAAAMAAGMAVLWVIGNDHVWTGAIGGLLAVTLRTFYLMSEEMSVRWDLTNRRVLGPQSRVIALGDIAKLNTIGNMVQIVTNSGDKHLIKYQADRAATVDTIRNAQTGAAV